MSILPERFDIALLAAELAAKAGDFTITLSYRENAENFFNALEEYNNMKDMNKIPKTLEEIAGKFPSKIIVGNEGSLVVYANWWHLAEVKNPELIIAAMKDRHNVDEADIDDSRALAGTTFRFWWD